MDPGSVTAIPGIPAEFQAIINLVFLAAVGIGGAYMYLRQRPAPQSSEVQIVGGALADRQSMTKLAEAIEAAIPILDRLADVHERDGEARHRDAEIIERAIKNVGEDIQRAVDKAANSRQ